MNWLDGICIILLFVSMGLGFTRGFMRDFIDAFVWFLSGFVAVFVAPYLVPYVSEHIQDITAARCMAVVIAYLLMLIAFLLIISMKSEKHERTILSLGNSIGGMALGFTKSVGLIVSFCLLLRMFEVPVEKYACIRNSTFITALYNRLGHWGPSMVRFDSFLRAMKTSAQSKLKSLPVPVKKTETEISANPPQEKTEGEKKWKLWDRIAEIIAGYHVAPAPIKVVPVETVRPISNSRAPYGCMSLMEARARRRAERKKLQIKKEIIKRLKANDSENIHKRRGETKRSSENIAPIARDEYQKKAQQNH